MWLISLGLGTTAIFGIGCRYQVPTRTHGGTNGAVRDLCIMVCVMVRMRDRDSHDSWSHHHRVLEDIMKPRSIILHHSHFVTRSVTKMWNTFLTWFQDYSQIGESVCLCIFVLDCYTQKDLYINPWSLQRTGCCYCCWIILCCEHMFWI